MLMEKRYATTIKTTMPKRSYALISRNLRRKRRSWVSRKKRRITRRNRLAIQKTSIQRGLAFSNAQLVRLRYVAHFFLDPAVNTAVAHVFRANSLFDPDFTAAGHQPYGFDTWATMYNHYTVLGSKIKVHFNADTPGTAEQNVVGIQLKDTNTVDMTDAGGIIEQGETAWKFCGNNGTGSKSHAYVTKGYSTRKFFQTRDVEDDIYRASVTGNPSETAFFHVIAAPFNPGDNPGPITCLATIDYFVKFTGRHPLPQS